MFIPICRWTSRPPNQIYNWGPTDYDTKVEFDAEFTGVTDCDAFEGVVIETSRRIAFTSVSGDFGVTATRSSGQCTSRRLLSSSSAYV